MANTVKEANQHKLCGSSMKYFSYVREQEVYMT